jgi:type II secretory ATPase GspE/PulE/Tfp pilus assembly ATPase PilB-like protein
VLISRVKILSGMDIAERRKPQDGRGKIRHEGQKADTRVSSMPTMHGETVVIRLLREEGEKAKTLTEVGLDETERVKLEHALDEPQGMLLITGPTGSGKTSTLYAALGLRIDPRSTSSPWRTRSKVSCQGSTRCRSTNGLA